MKSINLTDAEAKELVEFYSAKLKEAEVVVSRYKGLLDKLYRDHDVVKASNQLSLVEEEVVYSNYNSKWTWTQKIDYILEETGKPITKRDLLTRIFVLDPKLGETKESRAAAGRSVGATLSRQASNKRYKTFKGGDDNLTRYSK